MKSAPEQYRVKGLSLPDWGNNGAFKIPHYKINDYVFFCVISDGIGWEHVSVSLRTVKGKAVERCPTWGEMCFIKDLFYEDEETVMQLHPPKSEYVSTHPYCLHLWRHTVIPIPLPMSEQVGLKGDDHQSFKNK